MRKKLKIIETDSILLVIRSTWADRNGGDTGQNIMNTFSYKMNIFWGSAIQHGGENEHYCIVYLKFPN